MKKRLIEIAHGRSGDKGDAANVGIIAYNDDGYEIIRKHLTVEKVKSHFKGICLGEVERYELPMLRVWIFCFITHLGEGELFRLSMMLKEKRLLPHCFEWKLKFNFRK